MARAVHKKTHINETIEATSLGCPPILAVLEVCRCRGANLFEPKQTMKSR
jgi:hypothetical protein